MKGMPEAPAGSVRRHQAATRSIAAHFKLGPLQNGTNATSTGGRLDGGARPQGWKKNLTLSHRDADLAALHGRLPT